MSQLHKKSAISTYELLRTKLAPPRLQASLVPRAPLLERLAEGVERKLTLLSSPAGFGKTTLVSQWVHQLGLLGQGAGVRNAHPIDNPRIENPRVAWFSLDANDNDPVRFWRYVIAACQQFAPGIGTTALKLSHTASRPAWESVLTSLINDLAEATNEDAHAVLVLEDYHLITAEQVHQTLTFFLEHLPFACHLIITTRHDPPLPLAQMRARSELSEIRAADLRFSLADAQTFFQQSLPLHLAPAAINYLADRTEGWVAGLRLATLALQKRPEPEAMSHFLATFRGSHEHIFTYLVTEVLRAQPQSHQEFLLRTCMLSRLTSALCDAVTGRDDSELLLEELVQANLFLMPFVEEQEGENGQGQGSDTIVDTIGGVVGGANTPTIWYRYHTLFAEAMQQAARRQLGKDELCSLSHKASLWYEQHGLLTEAVETALISQDFVRSAALLERSVDPMNPSNEYHTLRRWIGSLPEAILDAHPALAFLYAVTILFTSERRSPTTLTLVQAPLGIAERHWLPAQTDGPNDYRAGSVLAFRSLIAWFRGALDEAFANARQALALLPKDEMQWRGVALIFVGVEQLQTGQVNAAEKTFTAARSYCESTGNEFGALDAAILLGDTYLRQAELRQAAQLYQYVFDRAERTQMEREQASIRVGSALLGLATLAYEWNELARAEQQAKQALAIGTQVGYVDLQSRASLLLARIEHVRGEKDAAQQRLHTLLAQPAQPRWATLLRRVRAEQAWLSLVAGDLAAVEQWAATIPHPYDKSADPQQGQESFLLARLWIAKAEANSALKLLARWKIDAREQGQTANLIEVLIIESLAHSVAEQLPQAHAVLLDALRLAQPSGYQRLFVDEGKKVAHLLKSLAPSVSDEPMRSYIAVLLATFGEQIVQKESISPLGLRQPHSATEQLVEPLSARECDVLRLVTAGLPTEEVARELVISVGTVRTHLKNIYSKLDAHSRVQAVERAQALNLL